jgi:hypothetical protein
MDLSDKQPGQMQMGNPLSFDSVQGQKFSDEKMSDAADTKKDSREHLKRRAHQMRNSKYDESYLIDFSGSRKFQKATDLNATNSITSKKSCSIQKSGTTSSGKIMEPR